MSTFIAQSNLRCNGKKYKAGDVLGEVSEKQAKALLASGTIVSAEDAEIVEDEAPTAPQEEQEAKTTAGGEEVKTGEPSIDGASDAPKTDATDVTPPTAPQE